jgi:hypothetical protein
VYRINVYIPSSHLETVKNAMFDAGAGRIGLYDQCCWQIEGQGQFRPLEGNQAFVGETNQLEVLAEYKVEMVCDKTLIKDVLAAMHLTHPYEEVAYDISLAIDPATL